MKKTTTVILFLLPLLLAAQQKPAGWLTPYADVTFKESKIVYSMVQPRENMRLLPRMYPRNLVSMSLGNQSVTVDSKYIVESQQKIRDYLATEPVSLRSAKEQNEYLRLSAMVLLWDMDLSPHCLQEIKSLQSGKDKTISKEANIILQVYEVYEKNRGVK